jgi:hypothetical protein
MVSMCTARVQYLYSSIPTPSPLTHDCSSPTLYSILVRFALPVSLPLNLLLKEVALT